MKAENKREQRKEEKECKVDNGRLSDNINKNRRQSMRDRRSDM